MEFDLKGIDGAARCGELKTAHGTIETPAFMPVGTAATVKAMMPDSVARTGARVLLGNTYHLMLRPGAERIASFGGLHEFMNWPQSILTDSGGFQVMSLSGLRKVTEKGVRFRSHIDGAYFDLTPERSIEIQHLLGSDITMAFDECTAYPVEKKEAQASMHLSMRWAERSKEAFIDRPGYGLFGIIQGSLFRELRFESIESLGCLDFDGYAVGGLAVGEGKERMLEVLDFTMPELMRQVGPDKPRYLMGVGKPDDLVAAVARGVDMFDCVLPTRSARHGQAWTSRGSINLKNARHRDDPRPLEESCDCPACSSYSRAYLHHLIKCGETLGAMLLTWHNLRYYQRLMLEMREAICDVRFEQFVQEFYSLRSEGDINPVS